MSKLDDLEKIDRDFLMPKDIARGSKQPLFSGDSCRNKSKNTQASAGRDKSEPLRGFSTTLP